MTIILSEHGPQDVAAQVGDGGALWLDRQTCADVSGWELKPEGLCRGDICVPVAQGSGAQYVREEQIDLAGFWGHMNEPFAKSRDNAVWAFGEAAAVRATELESLEAPDFSLPDLDGNPHALSDFRGQKILLATWASW